MITALAMMLAIGGTTPPVMQVEKLSCGATKFSIASSVLPGKEPPLTPVAQTLARRVGTTNSPVTLERGQNVVVGGHRVLGRYVTSWACLAGHRQHYVLLGYACAVDPGHPGDCGGEKEWFRLLDAKGRFADAGVPHDGRARERLNARLGVAGAMAAGVTMTPVIR